MNETWKNCLTSSVDVVYLNYKQLVALTIVDSALLTANAVTNTLVIYVLIKTGQLASVSCKFILQLSFTDILIALLTQSLFIAVLFDTKCSVKIASQFVSAFLSRVSGYTIALIGVDRFVRIKYGMSYTLLLTNKFAKMLMLLVWLVALAHSGMVTIGLLIQQEQTVRKIGMTFDGGTLVFVFLLQIASIKFIGRINSKEPEPIQALQEAENKITKLCSRIMLLLVFFLMPFIIVSIVRSKIRDELNTQSRALLEYVYRFSLLFAYSNSIANALLFLSTNTRAKRFLIRKLGFEKNRRPNDIQIRENQIVPN